MRPPVPPPSAALRLLHSRRSPTHIPVFTPAFPLPAHCIYPSHCIHVYRSVNLPRDRRVVNRPIHCHPAYRCRCSRPPTQLDLSRTLLCEATILAFQTASPLLSLLPPSIRGRVSLIFIPPAQIDRLYHPSIPPPADSTLLRSDVQLRQSLAPR